MIIPIEVIFWKASHRSDKTCIYYIQRKFCSSKTSELRTNVQGQSCHHVNHIVSKSSLRVRAAEKSNSSGTREFTGERQTLCFFGGCVPWVSLFPQVRASICKSCRKKCTGLWQELDLHCKVLKKTGMLRALWKMRPAKFARDCSESSISHKRRKLTRSEQCGIVPIVSAARTLVDLVRHSCYPRLQLFVTKCNGMATGEEKNWVAQIISGCSEKK